jgi:hypothetical protein
MRLLKCLAVALGAACLPISATVAAQDAPPPPRCGIDYFTSPEMLALISESENSFSFDGYDAFCQRLAAEGVGLMFDHHAGTSAERSYGWVAVSLIDLATGIPSSRRSTTITTTDSLEPAELELLLLDALETAVKSTADSQDAFIASMRAELAEVQQRIAPQ